MTLPALGWQGLVVLVVFGVSLLIATYSTYAERVIAAFLQDRVGPDRAGPFGLLQPLADAVKLFTKEEFFPAGANRALFVFGPCLAMVTALMSSAVIPFGNFLQFGDTIVHLQGIEINVGMLYVFGMVSLGVYGIMIGGWASNNKFSLLGAIRAASQNISYELAMGLALIAVLMISGTLSLREITLAAVVGRAVCVARHLQLEHHEAAAGLHHLHRVRLCRNQPHAVRPARVRNRARRRLPHRVQLHEDGPVPVCRVHQRVRGLGRDERAVLRRLQLSLPVRAARLAGISRRAWSW